MVSADPRIPRIRAIRSGRKASAQGRGSVLHSSLRAVNLVFADRVITLLNRQGLLSPSSIILNLDSIPDIAEAEFQEGVLVADSFSVIPSPTTDLSVRGSFPSDFSHLKKDLEKVLVPRDYSITKAALALESGLLRAEGVERAILERELEVLKRAQTPEELTKGLLGLGFGLTPSGDDFVLGMIAFLNLRRLETSEIREIVASYRNLFSRTILHNALDGEYPEPLYRFLKSVVAGGQLDEGIHHLLNMGHSSGYDTLTGFYHMIRLGGLE